MIMLLYPGRKLDEISYGTEMLQPRYSDEGHLAVSDFAPVKGRDRRCLHHKTLVCEKHLLRRPKFVLCSSRQDVDDASSLH